MVAAQLYGHILLNSSPKTNVVQCSVQWQRFGLLETYLLLVSNHVDHHNNYIFYYSYVFVALAWIIIPLDIGYRSSWFLYNSWRIFLAICSIPSILVAVFLFFLPESPKFLLTRNDHKKALEVFKQIYATNTGNDPEMYPVSCFCNTLKYNFLFFYILLLLFYV